MRRRHNENFRVSDAELAEVERIAKQWGTPRSEVWRRLLMTVKVIYDEELTLRDALQVNKKTFKLHKFLEKGDIPLYEAIRPVPELIRILDAKEIMKTVGRSKRDV